MNIERKVNDMESLLKSFVEITIFSSIMILMVLAIKFIWQKKINFIIISFLWVLVLARLLFPITIQSPIHIGSIFLETEPVSTVEKALVQNDNFAEDLTADVSNNVQTSSPTANTHIYSNIDTNQVAETETTGIFEKMISKTKSISLWKYIFLIWMLGMAGFWLFNLYHLVDFKAKVNKCRVIRNSTITRILSKHKRIIGINKKIEVIRCNYVNVPITFGLIKPKILIPFGFEEVISEVKLELILRHELYHIKRNDLLKNYLWLLAKSIHWFNPLVWIAYKEYLDDIELAVDNTILNNSHQEVAIDYSQSIIDVLKLSNRVCNIPAAMSFCKDKNKIRKRVDNMIKPTKKLKSVSTLTVILAIIMIIGCFTTACKSEDPVTINDIEPTEIANVSDNTDNTVVAGLNNDGLVASTSPEKRVGTEQNAIQIVLEHNISNSEKFIYEGVTTESSELLPYHTVKSDDDTDTMYQIYDFNGEFLMVTIESNYNEDKATISEEDAKEKAVTYINQLYNDVVITVNGCVLSRETSFIIEGELYKASENSTRKFSMTLNGAGEFAGIMAPYESVFSAGISDETQKIIMKYSQDKDVTVDLVDVEYIDGDEIYTFYMDNESSHRVGDQKLVLLASDNSLIEYESYLDRTDARLDLSDENISTLALAYIAQYFPELTDASIASIEKAYSECYVIADVSNSDKQVSVTIWANGPIKSIKMVDKTETGTNETSVNQEEIDEAREAMKDCGYQVLVGKEFEFIRKYEKADTDNQTVYEFEYKSASPSIRDYSMIVSLIYVSENDRYYAKVNPVLEELDIISEEEAMEKGRQYVAEKKGIDPSKLECTYKDLVPGNILAYEFDFEYDNTTYGAYIYPDTGEADTTGELRSQF